MNGSIKKTGILRGDIWLWLVFFALCSISLVEVYSASSNLSWKSGDFTGPLISHAQHLLGGVLVAWLMSRFARLWFIKTLLLVLYPVSVAMLLYVQWWGITINGAQRYLPIAGMPTFQPSELAKLSLVGVVSLVLAWGHDRRSRVTRVPHFWVAVGLTALVCALIVTENLSTVLIICGAMLVLAWLAKPPTRVFTWFVGAIAVVSVLAFGALRGLPPNTFDGTKLERFGTWASRMQTRTELPADPHDYDVDANAQKAHAKIALATAPVGVGQSVQRDFLPLPFTDFIYAIIIEEGGAAAGLAVMLLYLLLLLRCIVLAQECEKPFPAYLVMGLGMMLVIQAMVNMAVAVDAIPVTGQPLPMVSRGGTSIIITGMYIGIIQKISYSAKKRCKN